ncbi:MAG: HNH endonuclease [Candidatus Marinimicrobia bacterium]|nr:HNH endonuclease [Candidatus Neomarinimicrobiota bacterium]MBL7022609.1 HNH endonuclease [Candidatus Neomarinimicrobiota bacterium]
MAKLLTVSGRMSVGRFEYKTKPEEKLRSNFSQRKSKGLNGFDDVKDFLHWYEHQDKICYYCELKEEEMQEIVIGGILKSNRFPQNGIIGRGQSRGVWLEVDRLNPKGNYSRDNCVLCCYFCNNDKSDVFHGDDYKEFMENRVGYLKQKIDKK